MAMFMGLGMSLDEVVAAATSNGVAAMGLSDELGTLRVGAVGDAAVLDLEPGEFEYGDSQDETVQVDHRLNPVATVKDGKLWAGDSA